MLPNLVQGKGSASSILDELFEGLAYFLDELESWSSNRGYTVISLGSTGTINEIEWLVD